MGLIGKTTQEKIWNFLKSKRAVQLWGSRIDGELICRKRAEPAELAEQL